MSTLICQTEKHLLIFFCRLLQLPEEKQKSVEQSGTLSVVVLTAVAKKQQGSVLGELSIVCSPCSCFRMCYVLLAFFCYKNIIFMGSTSYEALVKLGQEFTGQILESTNSLLYGMWKIFDP